MVLVAHDLEEHFDADAFGARVGPPQGQGAQVAVDVRVGGVNEAKRSSMVSLRVGMRTIGE